MVDEERKGVWNSPKLRCGLFKRPNSMHGAHCRDGPHESARRCMAGNSPVRIMKGEREDYNSDRQSELPMVGYDVREGSSEGNKHATCNPCQ